MTTTTTERAPLNDVAEQGLLTALMAGREDDGEAVIENPLLLAALMRRRREEDDEPMIEHPLLLAALARRRRDERRVGIEHPMLMAALLGRRS